MILAKRPILLTCLLLGLAIPGLFNLSQIQIAESLFNGPVVYTIEIEDPASDPASLERSIAIPLEAAIHSLSGTKDSESICETGTVRMVVQTQSSTTHQAYYPSLREAVDRVWLSLDSSVQKPRIYSGRNDSEAIYVVSIESNQLSQSQLYDHASEIIKPALQGLDGVGQVQVGGGSQKEVHIHLDNALAIQRGITSHVIAQAIASSDLTSTLGRLRLNQSQDMPLRLSQEKPSISVFQEQVLGSSANPLPLANIAKIEFATREDDLISRIDGHTQVIIQVQSSQSGSIAQACLKIAQTIDQLLLAQSSQKVLVDQGKRIRDSGNGLLILSFTSCAMVFLILIPALGSWRSALATALGLPFHVLISLGIISLVGAHSSISLLAGIGIGLGLGIDSALLMFKGRRIALVAAGALTNLVVLIPLCLAAPEQTAIIETCLGYALVLGVASIWNCLFLPPLYGLVHGSKPRQVLPWPKSMRWVTSLAQHPWRSALIFSLICVFVMLSGFLVRVLSSNPDPDPSCTLHVEFAGGTQIIFVDAGLQKLAQVIAKEAGVQRVETLARRENGTIRIVGAQHSGMENRGLYFSQILEPLTVDCSIIPQNLDTSAYSDLVFTLRGPDLEKSLDFAQSWARTVSQHPEVQSVFFNFKDPAPALILKPLSDRLGATGSAFQTYTDLLQTSLTGPVIHKWIREQGEMDMRLFFGYQKAASRQDLLLANLANANDSSAIRVMDTFAAHESIIDARPIFRSSRERSLAITARIKQTSLADQIRLAQSLEKVSPMAPGYRIEADPRLYLEAGRQTTSLGLSVLALILIVLVLIFLNEQARTSCVIILGLIPALILPLLFGIALSSGNYTMLFTCLAIASGAVVNTAIVYGDSGFKTTSVIRVAMNAQGSTLVALGCSIATTLPFSFGGDSLVQNTSLIMLAGLFGALVCCFLFYPRLFGYLGQVPRNLITSRHKTRCEGPG